ncbi:MAG: FixH family protein [Kiloniellaceae bacterium]
MGSRTITGRHALIGVLAFFAVVFAANGAFVYLALDSWSGLSTENPYERGIAYNETLAAAAAQKALGWRARLGFTDLGAGRGRIEIAFADQRGAPLDTLEVSGTIRRPTHEGLDRAVSLAWTGPGRYAVELAFPKSGQWDVRLVARGRGDRRFEIEDRIWLK